MRYLSVLAPSVLPFLVCFPAVSQEIVSAHSGTLHFAEGTVLIDGQQVDHRPAVFPSIPQGSTLGTEKGRAEVLLTPNVVLRLDEDSAIRLASNSLIDTRIEFLRGSIIVDSMNAPDAPPVTITYQLSAVRFTKPGIYRIDADTGVLQAYTGEAKVTTPQGKTPVVDTSKLFFFDLGTVTNKFGEPNEDEFYDWARGRADAIAAENQLASEANAPPDDSDSGLGILNNPLPSGGALPWYGAGIPTSPGLGAYSFSDPWAYSYLGFAPGFATYNVFPMFVVLRPRNWHTGTGTGTGGSHWPHGPQGSAYAPTHIGTYYSPIRGPIYTPRPPASIGSRPAVAYHPHPVAPVSAPRAIGIHH